MKAFPKSNANLPSFQDGMDLRDYFAGIALPVFMEMTELNQSDFARMSYEMADEMMKARENKYE
jgi:hypothetical protein